MRNPWIELPERSPYVLPTDHPHVDAFNYHSHKDPGYRFDLSLLPQPFLGNLQAPLIVLGRNPDVAGGHRAGAYADAIRANLTSESGNGALLGLLPEFDEEPNARWWRRCFREVLDELGSSPGDIAPRILSIEFHGYHSERWKLLPTLPSQHYGFWLVEQAIARGATVVVMRGQRDWEIAVPALRGHRPTVTLVNPRSATISRANCSQNGFDAVLRALTDGRP